VYRAKHGSAPHKPLLLLVILELAENGDISDQTLRLTPELSFRFDSFWHVVAHRRTQRPDVRMPFHHLTSDGVWLALTDGDLESPHRKLTTHVTFDPEFLELAENAEFRERARRILIQGYFEPAERNALYHLVGMRVPSEDQIARAAHFEIPDDAVGAAREARFRLEIVPAYHHTCALTGYRVTTIGLGAIVDAAHIHQFSDSRNNDPKNGMALCKNAHWLFDVGLWSVGDDYRIVVAKDAFTEDSPHQKPLTEYHGARLRLPRDKSLWPDPRHLTWHRKHKFVGAA
jgi:putative restriction endonuclease